MADEQLSMAQALQFFQGTQQQLTESTKLAIMSYQDASKKLGVINAMKQANDQVTQIQNSTLKDNEKQAAMSDLSNRITRHMLAVNADPAEVQQAALSIAKPVPQAQSIEQGLMSSDAQTRALATQAYNQQQKDEMAMFQAKSDFGMRKEGRTALGQMQHQYNSEMSKIQKSTAQATQALNILNSNNKATRQMAASVLPTMLARASSEVGNLTADERAVYAGRQDYFSMLSRKISTGLYSELTQADRQALKEVASLYAQHGNNIATSLSDTMVSQLSPYHDVLGGSAQVKYYLTGKKSDQQQAETGVAAPAKKNYINR